jgi:hypothetical protein
MQSEVQNKDLLWRNDKLLLLDLIEKIFADTNVLIDQTRWRVSKPLRKR